MSSTSFSVVIPARYASSRLPGKPLLQMAGKPMIQHVWEQARKSQAREVIVATDDERIAEAAQAFGARVCMTRSDHPSGTDRLQEVAAQLQMQAGEILVNVQGDEPLLPPALINQVAENLASHRQASIATLSEPITEIAAVFNPNIVKVVTDKEGLALYFSRSPQPWTRNHFHHRGQGNYQPESLPADFPYQRHLGLYAYYVDFLNQYVTWKPAPLEEAEQLEQLRALWNGHRIHVAQACEQHPHGVDTEEDYLRVKKHLERSG
ncbi:3-deoxy-manno-octulosonate cytidylyltransferase [Marinospirillum perlucidum]|uniref:3-deoxy-manno-octulosonate cytidylyltransferase n=1 Tax=Marinospirillum perlucidum TaxID=1982602 RepID=UPI000DF471F9|nr:3-deoxy-manno-octulosonate cytidylyltransferase [Marinospirillum perlucidum]